MHRVNRRSRFAGMVLVLAAFSYAGTAHAAGTSAATPVNNVASVVYDVGSTTQPAVPSPNVQFLVDHLVDLTVAEVSGTYTTSPAGGTNEVLTFTVTNTGNATMDFLLSAADQVGGADPFGGTDNFNAVGGGIFVDSNGNGVYDAGVDTATFIDQLGEDATETVFVVRNIPAGQANGDVSAITLTAQAADANTVGTAGVALVEDLGADIAGTVQIVFGDSAGDTDAAGDGQHSDTDAYLVGAANITVAKASDVVSDPFNGTTNPKAIPGAVVEYTITITNGAGASATATNVTVTDDLTTEIVTNGSLAFDTNGYGAGNGMEVTAPNINGGAAQALSNAVDADEGDFTANVVTVSGIDLAPGEAATVTFRVVIQ